jgi:hypothetical protein
MKNIMGQVPKEITESIRKILKYKGTDIKAGIKGGKKIKIPKIETFPASKLYKTVRQMTFNVEGVSSYTELVRIIQGPIRIGSRATTCESGTITRLVLDVVPNYALASDEKIKKLEFFGDSPVRGGDSITAKIPFYHEIENWDGKEYSLRREIYKIEAAIEIGIRGDKGKILRIDRSADYGIFAERLIGKD